jgi:hypothetical protein
MTLMLLGTLNVSSQSLIRCVISVTGNTTVENNGRLSYSAGEAITGSLISPANGITQGFQQPSLLNLDADNVIVGINAVEVYPNPVLKNLTILFNIRNAKLLNVDLISSQGTLLKQDQFYVTESGWIDIDMENFPCGLYLIHIYSMDKVIDRVFKIEKM